MDFVDNLREYISGASKGGRAAQSMAGPTRENTYNNTYFTVPQFAPGTREAHEKYKDMFYDMLDKYSAEPDADKRKQIVNDTISNIKDIRAHKLREYADILLNGEDAPHVFDYDWKFPAQKIRGELDALFETTDSF